MLERLKVAVYRCLPRAVSSGVVRILKRTYPIAVVAIVFDEHDRVLLLKHTYHTPAWRLPGGLMDHGETPRATAVRELFEEANCVIEPIAIVDAASVKYTFDVAVLARLVQSRPFQANAEVTDYAWTEVDRLPSIPAMQREFLQRAYDIWKLIEN